MKTLTVSICDDVSRLKTVALIATLFLSACGGGGGEGNSADLTSFEGRQAQLATGSTTLTVSMPNLPEAAALHIAQPFFHSAPGLLPTPDDRDTFNPDTSSRYAAHRHAVPRELIGLSSQRLTAQDMREPQSARSRRIAQTPTDGAATPMAASSVFATYTPAQIRAAYSLPTLQVPGAGITSVQAAQLGVGQTIYIVAARHNPNSAAELAAFNSKFGLPSCSTKSIATIASLPLPAASTTACEFSVVFSTANGAMSSSTPTYDAGWAMEISLDVQWAHATAPLARIVLIEAPDATLNNLLGAVKLANSMGPGVVSMSFGAAEGSWTSSVDSVFTGLGMTYLAATGDSGAAVSWPSVSSNVLAVGGTSLTYTGFGARSEVSWSGTGGGISSYTPTPTYQNNVVPGINSWLHRAVADVAFNADPASGQYAAVQTPGTASVSWLSVGGTSLSTPQWAGLIAIVNSARAQSGKAALGAPHAILYGQIAAVPGTYANVFADITAGSNGTCTLCSAKPGYDPLTGLGTPNVTGLLNALASSGATKAPVVTPADVKGVVGAPLSFTASASAPSPIVYTLTNAPAGMVISSTGVVTWPVPVVGTYAVTVGAKEIKTALNGQGVYTITIAQQSAPLVLSTNASGKAGSAFLFATTVTATNPVSYSMTGAPLGMTINGNGVISWTAPLAGNYSVTVLAKDSKTGLTGKGIISVTISESLPPSVGTATILGKPGVALSFVATSTSVNPVTYSLSGGPLDMVISSNGVVSWEVPVVGIYNVNVKVKDTTTGLSSTGIYTVRIETAGPVIMAAAINGVGGKAISGSIGVTDTAARSLSITISGVPLGMIFAINGSTINIIWTNPIIGNYSLKVIVLDNLGQSSTKNIPVTITAK